METFSIFEIATGKALADGLARLEADKWVQERVKYGHKPSEYDIVPE